MRKKSSKIILWMKQRKDNNLRLPKKARQAKAKTSLFRKKAIGTITEQ